MLTKKKISIVPVAYKVFYIFFNKISAVFSFSFAPIEWVFYLAFLGMVISLVAAAIYILLSILSMPPKEFPTLLLAVLFMGSVQMAALSIICEYLRRIFEEVKNRPLAIVKGIINDRKPRK